MKLSTLLTFNIIFVPGTVEILKLAIASLLDNSSCRFRLVSNGCNAEENRLLQDWCEDHPRLEFLIGSRDCVLLHGEMLTRLQRDERSDHFAFMDSDIFASGDFVKELTPFMQTNDAFFSAPPIWSTEELQIMPPKNSNMNGVFNQYSDGTCLGSSYFAIYDNAVLTKCMQETGVTLKPYFWKEITPSIQEDLRRANKSVDVYDTGKLINILLGLRGYRCRFTHLESLCHIGGISGASLLSKHGLLWLYASPLVPNAVIKVLRWAGLYKGYRDKVNRQERQFYELMIIRRRAVCSHISAYLKHLVLGTPKPPAFRHKDSQLAAVVQKTEQLLIQLHKRFGDCPLNAAPLMADANSTTSTPVKSEFPS